MLRFGHKGDNCTYPFVFTAFGDLFDVENGRGVHCEVVVNRFESGIYECNSLVAQKFRDKFWRLSFCPVGGFEARGKKFMVMLFDSLFIEFLNNSLVEMYCKCNSMDDARTLLRKWQEGYCVLEFYDCWLCRERRWLRQLKEWFLKEWRLANLYNCARSMSSGHSLVIWHIAMISGYGVHGTGRKGNSVFHEMIKKKIIPDEGFLLQMSACRYAGLVYGAPGGGTLTYHEHGNRFHQ
ncbi:hypothetical protein OIU78_025743 [Salix suchowensis]|nr:hypothetical protein OIU78_025743 [Salix suchowensis]